MWDFLWHLWDENVTKHWHWLVVLRPVLVTANLKCHKHTWASDLCCWWGWCQSCTEPANVAQLALSRVLLGGRGAFMNTHSAFLITLSQHGDGAGACFPDHPPKVSHGAWQRTLGGDELIGAKIALEMRGVGGGGGIRTLKYRWLGMMWLHLR